MFKPVSAVIAALCLLLSNQLKAQVPITYYDFESNVDRNNTVETTVQESISGIGSPSITATSLTSADGIGNGATYTGTNTGYALGYFGFTSNASSTATDPNIKFGPFNCTGFSTLTITMDVRGVGTQAPDNVDIYWSTNDIAYTRINVTTVVVNGTWNTRSFTVPAGADGAATLYFKVMGYNGGATPTAGDGEMKIDNFTLRSSAITASNTLISRTAHGTGLSSGGTFLPTYTSLNVNGASINVTAASDIVFTGTLTLTNGNFVMTSDSLAFQTGNTPIARNGTTQTGNIVMGLTSKLVFGRPSNVGGNAFTIPNNVFSTNPLAITALTIQHTNAITLNNQDITLLGNLNLASGTLNDGGRTISLTLGNITGTGTQTGSGLIAMTGIGATVSGATLLNLQLNNLAGFSLTGSPTIAGTLTLTDGPLTVGANTLTFRTANVPIVKASGTITVATTSNLVFGTSGNLGGNAFTIPNDLFTSAPSINNLTLNRTNSITIGNQAFTINGSMTLTAGVFDALNTTLTFQTGNTPLARTAGTLTLGSTANLIFGTAGNLGGNAFTIPASMFTSNPSINSLTVNRTNALTLNSQILTLDGALTLTAGAFSIGTGTLVLQTVATPIVRTSGTITVTTSSNLTFGTQASALTIPDNTFTAAPSLNNLTIDRVGGVTVGNQAFTINGTLSLTSGVFDILSTAIVFQTGATPITRTSGTLTVGTATNITFGTNAAAFTIPNDVFTTAPTITNLTINRAGGITIGNQAFILNGILTLTAGVLDVLNTTLTFQTSNTPLARTSGTLTLGTTANLVFGTPGNLGGNAFTIPNSTFTTAPSFNNLTVNRTNALTLGNQSITLDGTLTLTAGAFAIAANSVTFQNNLTPIVRTSGTITVTTSSNITFGTQASALTIPDGTFTAAPSLNNLTIDRAGGVTVGNQAFTINGTLTLTSGVFDILNTAIIFQTGATPIARTSGTLTVGASTNITFGANAGAFTIPDNTFTTAPSFTALTINRAGGVTLGNQNMTLAGTLTLTAGTLNDNGRTITVAGNIAGTATHASTGTGEILMTGSGATIATVKLGNIELNNAGGFSFTGAATINGTMILTNGAVSLGAFTQTFQTADIPISKTGGTITALATSSLVFGTAGNVGGNSFTLPNDVFTSAPTIVSFTVNRTNPLVLGNQNLTLTGILTLTAGEFDIAANTLTFQTGNTPIVRTAGTITTSTSSNLIFGTTGNIGGNAFAIPNNTFTSGSINSFTIQRTNALTLGNQDITLAGNLNLTAGTLNDNARTITLTTGNITGAGTIAGTGLALMTGNGATISGATLVNLQLNNAGGFSLTGSPTVAGTLTLTDGALTVGTNTLTFRTADIPLARTGGTITSSSTSNFIFGTAGNTGGNAFTIPDDIFTTAPSLNNFTVNRTNSLTIGNQDFTINGALTLTAGVFDALNTTLTFQIGATPIVRTTGTLTLGATANLVFGTPGNLGGAAFTIPASTFTSNPSINSFTVNRTNALTMNTQTLTLDGVLTLTAGAFSIGSGSLILQTAATPIARTSGTITVTTSSNLTFGTQATAFIIPDNTFTAAPSLGNLSINRAGGVTVGNQAFTINNTLTLSNGVFDILNTAIIFQTGASPIARTSGTLTVGTATSITFGTNAAAFTIPDNTFTAAPVIAGLTINRAGGVTVGNQSFTIAGALTLTAGVFDALNTTLTFQTANGPIVRNGTSQTGTITLGSTANLVFGTPGNTAGNAFTIPNSAFTTAPVINNFTVNRTNTLTLGNQSLTLNGTLTLTLGAFSIANNTLTLQNNDVPLARTSGTLTVGATANLIFGTPGNTAGASFTIPNTFFTATPPSFSSFTINRSNPLTLNATQGFTLAGDLNLTAGTLDNAGRAITMSAGNITGTGTETGAGIISMTASGATISGATISNLALSNAGGFSLTGSPIFTSTLTLTNGALAVGTNTLTFHTGNTPIARTSGTITLASTSSLAFGTTGNTGGTAFTIPANTFTSAPEFTNLSINRTNSLTLNSQDFALTGLFTLTAGNLILPSAYTFTLRSTSITNTALVDVVGATGIITYNTGAAFKVERYIPQTGAGVRAYRDVAPSVNTGTRRIFDTWQEGGTNGLVNGVNYGTHITGVAGASPGGTDAATGLDITSTGSQSLFSSNISLLNGSDAFQAITSTNQANDTLSAFKGYRLLIRGNRLVNLYQTPQPTGMNAAAVIRSTGTLITGQVTFATTGVTANGGTNTNIRLNSASASGFTMIGNPYASPVVWDSLAANATSIQSTYWLFDPNIGTGSYVTYNTLTGSSNIASNANKYIQPGQAIFVKNSTLTPLPVLVFKESYKAPNIANLTGIFKEVPTNLSKINISLKKPITNRGIVTVDGTAMAYNNSFTNNIGPEDGNKITNGSENIAINSNSSTLSIEGRKTAVVTDTIFLRLWQVTAGVSYQLEINTTDFVDNGLKPFLLDRFTNTQTELPLKGIKNYPFVTTVDTSSYNFRFKIVFKSNFITLPISFTNVKASAYNKGVNVEWAAIESNMSSYQVQRSADGINFANIGAANAKGNGNSSSQQYLFYDASPLNTNYYRIQSTDLSGKVAYSNIVLVNIANKKESITVFPNPIKGKTINLQVSNIQQGNYNITLYNLSGQTVFVGKINIGSSTVTQAIQLSQALPAGSYMLSIVKDDISFRQQVIVQ